MCGGTDRFRFDDREGSGSFFCSHCGSSKSGVDLVMKFKGVNFTEAKRLIEAHLGEAQVIVPKASKSEEEKAERARDQMASLWNRGKQLDGTDTASRYLAARGIKLEYVPTFLRFIPDLAFYHDDKRKTEHPALITKFVAPDNSSAIIHRTYLAEPGVKANIPKVKMIMPGKVPRGGAVRLAPAAEIMGIAEGLESALSAQILLGIPVWSSLTAGNMINWVPPKEARKIYILGDCDSSYAGQYSAYALAYRLNQDDKGKNVSVRFPKEFETDWNDILKEKRMTPEEIDAFAREILR